MARLNQQNLCAACSQIVLIDTVDKVAIRTYPDTLDLRKSAETGCYFCRMINTSHEQEHTLDDKRRVGLMQDTAHSEVKVYHVFWKMKMQNNVRWECNRTGPRETHSLGVDLGGFYAESTDPAANYVSGRRPGFSSRSSESISLLRGWLYQCTAMHSECSSPKETPLPTRVLRVHGKRSNGDPNLFISKSSSIGSYAALSYCWGKSQSVTLTRDTLADKIDEIPIDILPRTIQDAIVITRQLGLEYLWVDALCIIQDSKQDWQLESSNMGRIYNCATVTIQASGADTSHGGCFIERHAPQVPPAKLRFRAKDGTVGSVFINYDSISGQEMSSPLQKRGWTLQEELLSPRIISFGAKQLSWECRSAFLDECGAPFNQNSFGNGLPKPVRVYDHTLSIPEHADIASPIISAQLTWSYVLKIYSSRDLTFAKDKLPALSGLARYLEHTRPGDRYCAGLWRKDMPGNLLWTTTNGTRKFTGYRAPSWTWASLDGNIEAFGTSYDPIDESCEVLDVDITLAGLDPYGEVSHGWLVLRGKLNRGWFNEGNDISRGVPEQVHFFFDKPPDTDKWSLLYRDKRGLHIRPWKTRLAMVFPDNQT